MNILQVANKFPYPPKDGGSIATLSLSKSLADLGHQVTVLAMNTSKHFVDISTIPQNLKSGIRFIGVPVNTDIRLLKLAKNCFFSSLPYNAERFISSEFDVKLAEVLSEGSFDIVQLEGLYLAPYLETIRKYSRAKVAMRAHNIEHEIWERAVKQQKGPKKIYMSHLAGRIRRMELGFLNKYDALLPITSRDGERFRKLGCHISVHVVPTGINAAELVPDHSSMEFPSVFHIGALDWIPNQEGVTWFLDHIWEKIVKRYPGLRFYIAGRNAPYHFKHLRHPNVVFMGEVDDAYEFMKSKAIMVVPVFSGSGMRIKIIEGMALGKAIVTTTIGTEGINTTHGENILVADEAQKFADEVCRLIENKELFGTIQKNACTFVRENYDNLAITSALVRFYEHLKA